MSDENVVGLMDAGKHQQNEEGEAFASTTPSTASDGEVADEKYVSNVVQIKTPFSKLAKEFSEIFQKQGPVAVEQSYNFKLYELLAICHGKHEVLKDKTHAEHKALTSDLEDFIQKAQINFAEQTKLLSKVIRCVLHVPAKKMDNRKVNAYCAVIHFADGKKVKPEGLVDFLKEQNGIEKTRLAYYKWKEANQSPAQLAAKAKKKLAAQAKKKLAAQVKADAQPKKQSVSTSPFVGKELAALTADNQYVLIVTKLDDGSMSISGVVKQAQVIQAALTSVRDESQDAVDAEKPFSDQLYDTAVIATEDQSEKGGQESAIDRAIAAGNF